MNIAFLIASVLVVAGFIFMVVMLIRARRGGWAIALVVGAMFLVTLGVAGTFVIHEVRMEPQAEVVPPPVQPVRTSHPESRFLVEDDLRKWQQAQVLEAAPPSKSWVSTAGGSKVLERTSAGLVVKAPGKDGEMVGYSDLEPTPDEALRSARRSVSQQLGALVLYKLREMGTPQAAAAGEVEAAVARFLALPSLETESYQESVKLPQSGSVVHRAAILVKLPHRDQASALAREVQVQLRHAEAAATAQRTSLLSTVISALLLGLVIFLIYSYLNASSKGHLAWPLRFVSLAAFCALCLMLHYFRGRFP